MSQIVQTKYLFVLANGTFSTRLLILQYSLHYKCKYMGIPNKAALEQKKKL